MSDSATPWTAAHQPPCPSPTPGVYSNSCPLSRWCHLTISSSIIPFCSCLQSFPASVQFSSVQSLSHVRLFATPWTAAHQASLSITNSQSPPKPMSIESVMPSNHLILCCPLLLLPSIFPSIRVFSNESAHLTKVLEFQLQHKSFQWTPRTDLFQDGQVKRNNPFLKLIIQIA